MDSEWFDEVLTGGGVYTFFVFVVFRYAVSTSIDRLWIDFGRYVKHLFSERADLVYWIIKENEEGCRSY